MLSVDKTTMRLDVEIRIETDFDFLSDEYRAFFNRERATAFQAPIWLDTIHRKLALGLNACQQTLTIRNRGDGALIALIPLVIQRSTGLKILQPADFGVCDYNTVVGDRAILETLADDRDVVDRIGALTKACDIMMFRKVRDDSFDVSRLLRNTKITPNENAAYHSETGDDFDEWRHRTVRKKFSKELARMQRVIERDEGSYEHRPAVGEAEIRAAFERMREMRVGKFDEDLFASPLYYEFYLAYALAACPSGEAITYVSYAGGVPIAILFGLNGDGDFHAVLLGSDTERFGKSSPGTQIIYQVIQRRFNEGYRRFDMGLGNTGYKTHFRVDETHLRNITQAHSVGGAAMELVYHHAKPVKNFLRKYVRNVR